MKLVVFLAKIGGAGVGALGGLITFMIGLFSDKALAGTSTIGLALFGICVYLGGVVLESTDLEALFASTTTPVAPQVPSDNPSYDFSNTQAYSAPQQPTSHQSIYPPQAYTPSQQPAPQQSFSPAQQSFNASMHSANQSYQNNYSFDTPADPQ